MKKLKTITALAFTFILAVSITPAILQAQALMYPTDGDSLTEHLTKIDIKLYHADGYWYQDQAGVTLYVDTVKSAVGSKSVKVRGENNPPYNWAGVTFYFDEKLDASPYEFFYFRFAVEPAWEGDCQVRIYGDPFKDIGNPGNWVYRDISVLKNGNFQPFRYGIGEDHMDEWQLGGDPPMNWAGITAIRFICRLNSGPANFWIDGLYFSEEPQTPPGGLIDSDMVETDKLKLSALLYRDGEENDPDYDFYAIKATLEDKKYKNDPNTGLMFVNLYMEMSNFCEEVPSNHKPEAGSHGTVPSTITYSFYFISFNLQIPAYWADYEEYHEGGQYKVKWSLRPSALGLTASGFLFQDYGEFAVGVRVPAGSKPFITLYAEGVWFTYVALAPPHYQWQVHDWEDQLGWAVVDPVGATPFTPTKPEPINAPEVLQEPQHDVAVTSVSVSPTKVRAGEPVNINVEVENQGDYSEGSVLGEFNVTAYYDGNAIDTIAIIALAPGTSVTVPFTWNTTGVAPGTYTIKAVASTVPAETETDDNTYVDGTVTVEYHDVTASDTLYGLTEVYAKYWNVTINVTVENQGDLTETFNVTAYYGESPTPEQWETFWSMGDVNEDGYIDDTDLNLIVEHYETSDPDPQYDINKDGVVDYHDWMICIGHYGLDIWTHFGIAHDIGKQTVDNLPAGSSTTLTFIWDTDTTNETPGNYTISAKVTPLPGETHMLDNTYIDGTIRVKKLGDVNGDGVVDLGDVIKVKLAYSGYIDEPRADLNYDGVVDMGDVRLVKLAYSGLIDLW